MGIVYGTGCGVQNVNVAGSTITGASGGGGYAYDTLKKPIDVKTLKMALSRRLVADKFLNEKLGIQQGPADDDVVFNADRKFETELADYKKRHGINLGEKPVDKKK